MEIIIYIVLICYFSLEELGINDYGKTPEKAIENLKNGINLLISVEPEKADLF